MVASILLRALFGEWLVVGGGVRAVGRAMTHQLWALGLSLYTPS
jgi:hypothetical protein